MAPTKNTTKAADADEKTGAKGSKEDNGAEGGAKKRSLSAKEPPQFRWKIVGRSGDHVVTLFKAAEREDAEVQFQRLRREGYYLDLQILDIDAVVQQPTPTKASRAAKKTVKKTAKASAKKSVKRTKTAVRAPVVARFKTTAVSRSKTAGETSTAGAKKTASRSAKRSTSKKKAAPRKTTPRKAIKKKK